MADVSRHIPKFIVKNNSGVVKKIDRITLQPGDTADIALLMSEFDIVRLLTTNTQLNQFIRDKELDVLENTLLHQFGGAAVKPDLQVQPPLMLDDGLLSIGFVNRQKSGIMSPEDFSRIAGTEDMVKVWVSTQLTAADGPEIHVDLRDDRIFAMHHETAVIRSKRNPKRKPRAGLFGKEIDILFVTADKVVLTDKLPEDAIVWVMVSVSHKNSHTMAIDPPPGHQGQAHQPKLTAETAEFDHVKAKTAEFSSVKLEEMSSSLVIPFGHGLTLDGGGKFTGVPFPYTSAIPPNAAYDGMLWHKLPEHRQAFWCDKDQAWYWSDRRAVQFLIDPSEDGSAFNRYRTSGHDGKIDRFVVEAQGKTSVSLSLDGRTAHTVDINGFSDQYLNLAVSANTRIKIFNDNGASAPAIVATVYIRIRAA